ncbi:MAG: ribonuclease III [Desulfuromonas sp.]|nr:MAG: ribonuclease III [Desulfuromonas sp.]
MAENRDLSALQQLLGREFERPDLLERALTHKSWSNEHPHSPDNNERLEFLGDAVLDLVIGHELFAVPDRLDEGVLTRVRAELVSEKGLALVAREMTLGDYLRLGRGERLNGGADKDSLLSNTLEALLGALFLDGGYETAAAAIRRLFGAHLARALQHREGQDFKSRLQELLQAKHGAAPHYRELQVEGPPHARCYTVALEFRGELLAEGQGRSKKEAEQAAARQAFEQFDA